VCITGTDPAFSADGQCLSGTVDQQLRTMAGEVLEFARLRNRAAAVTLQPACDPQPA